MELKQKQNVISEREKVVDTDDAFFYCLTSYFEKYVENGKEIATTIDEHTIAALYSTNEEYDAVAAVVVNWICIDGDLVPRHLTDVLDGFIDSYFAGIDRYDLIDEYVDYSEIYPLG